MNDLPICLKHTFRCQFTNTADRIFHSFFYDTVTTDSADLPFDTYKIEQEGENGLDEVVYEDTYT